MRRFIYMVCMCLCVAQAHAFVFSKTRVRIMDSEGYLLVPQMVDTSLDQPSSIGAATRYLPAVLLLHDHGAWFSIGKEKLVRPLAADKGEARSHADMAMLADAEAWVNRCYDSIFVGDSLASLGYVVLCVDAPGWGSQVPISPDWETIGTLPQKVAADSLKAYNKRIKNGQPDYYQHMINQTGEAWFEHTLALDKACVSYLLSLPYVDSTSIACFGFSMGAYRAWQLAAEDHRVTACVASNWMTTMAANGGALSNASAYSMYRPDCTLDYPAIAAQIAPRPLVLMYGEYDHLFPVSAVEEAIAIIGEGYRVQQAETAFLPIAFPVKHFFSREQFATLVSVLRRLSSESENLR